MTARGDEVIPGATDDAPSHPEAYPAASLGRSASPARRVRAEEAPLPQGITRVPGSDALYIRVPRPGGGTWRTSARTASLRIAADMLGLLRKLALEKPERRVLLDHLREGTVALWPRTDHPGEEGVYDVLAEEGMAGADRLLARLARRAADIDLVPLTESFAQFTGALHPRKSRPVSRTTRRNDARSVRAFLRFCAEAQDGDHSGNAPPPDEAPLALDAPFECRSPWVTPAQADAYLTSLAAQPGARRKHHLAIRLFVRYCQHQHAMTWLEDPTADITLEAVGEHRLQYLEQVDCERLVAALDAVSPMHGDFSRILHGTGLDVGDVASLTAGDIDLVDHRIRSIGGKTMFRQRRCLVLDWAWPAAQRLLVDKHGGDRLFPTMPENRHAHDKAHARARARLVAAGFTQFAGYQPRDARHSVAVQMILAGVPLIHVARQLGHRDGALVLQVYAQFIPDAIEERQWQQQAPCVR